MNLMKTLFEINVYAGCTLLASLRKHDDLLMGIYSNRLRSRINLTPAVKENVKFQIDTVSLSNDDTSLLVSRYKPMATTLALVLQS